MRNFLYGLAISIVLTAGTAAALSPYKPVQGGTGISTIPTYGQVLVGDGSGAYTLMATSSLGISVGSSSWATTSSDYWLSQRSTTNLSEGSNLYFTTARATTSFIGNLAGTTSVASITTLSNLSLPSSQITGLFSYPFPSNATSTYLSFNGGLLSATTSVLSLNGTLYPSSVSQIIASLAQCGSNGYNTVHILPGTYTLSSGLSVPSNCTVEGEASSTVMRPQSAFATFYFNGVNNSGLRNITVDGSDNATYAASFGVRILNSSDIRISSSKIVKSAGFGIFIDASGVSTSTRIWIRDNYVTGRGNADVIGGGPQNSTGAIVTEVHIDNNVVAQDATVGSYQNAFDLTHLDSISLTNNSFYGIVQPGSEQYPHSDVVISNNRIYPAIGRTATQLYVSTNNSATIDSSRMVISGNVISSGELKVVGTSTSYIRNISITGNVIYTSGVSQNGITLDTVLGGVVSGNTIHNAASCIYLSNAGNVSIGDNAIGPCNYGIQDASGTTTNSIGLNKFYSILNTETIGAQGIVINNNDTSATKPVALTIQSSSASSTLRLINTSGFNPAYLEFQDVSRTAPAGNYQIGNNGDALSFYRGVLGISAAEKMRIDASGVTIAGFQTKAQTLGVFSGSVLTSFPATGLNYINNGSNFGLGTTSPWALYSIHANNGGTNSVLFAIASSTASATTTLLSVSNEGGLSVTGTYQSPPDGVTLSYTNGLGSIAVGPVDTLTFLSGSTEYARFTASGLLGIGSTTPWGLLSVASSTYTSGTPLFTVATSSDQWGRLFHITATSSDTVFPFSVANAITYMRNILSGLRVAIGFDPSDPVETSLYNFQNNVYSTSGKIARYHCDGLTTVAVSANTNSICGPWGFRIDTSGNTTALSAPSIGFQIHLTTTANIGAGVTIGGAAATGPIKFATTTPIFEAAVGAVSTTAGNNAVGSTTVNVGFVNTNLSGTSYEVEPTIGCYYQASSTKANWQALCRSSATLVTQFDTGIPTSTIQTAATQEVPIYRMYILADIKKASFYIQSPTSSPRFIGSVSGTNYSTTTALFPAVYVYRGATTGLVSTINIYDIDLQYQRPFIHSSNN